MSQTAEQFNQRRAYIDGLRDLAAILESDHSLPLPYQGTEYSELMIFAPSKAELIAWSRAIPGALRKEVDDKSEAYGFELHGSIAGLHVALYGNRDEVCTRRVVATREVTEEVPDPDAPLITVTKTVEDVEWDCHAFTVVTSWCGLLGLLSHRAINRDIYGRVAS